MNKKSFILYADYLEHFLRLPNEEAGLLIKATLVYVNSGDENSLPPAADMAFSFIKKQIDRDSEKWRETCKKRSEAGKKGGRPKKANAFSEKQTKAKKADNDNVNDTDNDNDILSLSENNDNIKQDCTVPERTAQPAPEENVIPWEEMDPDEWC